jgi:hypothetical protein
MAVVALGSAALAQSETLVRTGDSLPGIGTVVSITSVSVADSGDWVAHVATDFPDAQTNEVLLKNGAVYLREGDAISGGATNYRYFGPGWPRVNSLGQVAWTQPGATAGVEELLVDAQLLYRTGDPVLAAGFTPGVAYVDFKEVILNDARQLLVQVSVDDPAIQGFFDYAILRIQLDAAGLPITEEVLLKEGDPLFGEPLVSIGSGALSGAMALNESGDMLLEVNHDGVLLNQTLVAESGGFAPIFGESWGFLYSSADLGDNGDYAFAGRLLGSDSAQILVWNGVKVIQEGETLAAFAPHALEDFEGGGSESPSFPNIFVDAAGRVLWHADWDDPDETRDSGILLDHELVLQEGVSIAAGQRIDEIGAGRIYEFSDNGRYFAYHALLADGTSGAFLLDLEPSLVPHAGCTPNLAVLGVTGEASPGSLLLLLLDNAQAHAVDAYAALSLDLLEPCGTVLPGAGELLIGSPFLILPLESGLVPVGPAVGNVSIPAELSLIGATVHAQGLMVDLAPGAAAPLRLSDAVTIHIGF